MQALSTITHHSVSEVQQSLAQYTPTFLRLIDEFPENMKLLELTVGVLSHAINAVLSQDDVDSQTLRRLNMPSVFRHILAALRNPNATSYLLSHAFNMMAVSSKHCHKDIKAVPALVNFIVAGLRCDELASRCRAWAALFAILDPEAERGYPQMDSQKLIASLRRGIPEYLTNVLVDWGNSTECDVFVIPRTSQDYQQAMMRCLQDRNMLALGRTLAGLITRAEYSIADGAFQAQNERTGRLEIIDTGLPFRSWLDALPICAAGLRQTGNASDADMADTLEMKFFLMRKRVSDAVALAQRAVERNAQVAYFYYVMSLTTDMPAGLRACKKGLKCRQITPFVRTALLVRAVDHAAQLGMSKLADVTIVKASVREEAVAFLVSAQEDAKTFISVAPPDSRHMPKMLDWSIMLTLALRGKELSTDLSEFEDHMKKLETTKEFSKLFGVHQQRTTLRLTRELVTSKYQKAVTEWGSVIARVDGPNFHETLTESEARAEDNLAAWLEGLRVEGDEEEEDEKWCVHPTTNMNSVALYRCSYCGNPSAVLRKCSGCNKTRYCDSACQKMHWKDHKTACKEVQSGF
ncbi:hypothetical protein EIP86_004163 [Pleurotus ostreatoroseus]|nr:hypothetical protein EIP86_004163 [Pleurotus ostreatoroseus]